MADPQLSQPSGAHNNSDRSALPEGISGLPRAPYCGPRGSLVRQPEIAQRAAVLIFFSARYWLSVIPNRVPNNPAPI